MATTLHDHAITDALSDATAHLDPRLVVGIMGGHALLRTDQAYRAAAELSSALTLAGRTVLTGGGPGAMEAGNLGAYLSTWPDALHEALAILGPVPTYRPDIDAWAATAYAVRKRWPAAAAGASLAIPTWFYGHEPTNLFATGIAKYFANALREDSLLHRCHGGNRLSARTSRHGAGDLPGGDRELLRRRHHPGRSDDPDRSRLLDQGAPGLAAAAPGLEPAARWAR